jgi:hypothetical protein
MNDFKRSMNAQTSISGEGTLAMEYKPIPGTATSRRVRTWWDGVLVADETPIIRNMPAKWGAR